jgi:hypothetical protein
MAKMSVRNVELLDYIAQYKSQRKANRPRPNTTEWNVVLYLKYGFGAFDYCRRNLSNRSATSLKGARQQLYGKIARLNTQMP